jgi:hypothetical protein
MEMKEDIPRRPLTPLESFQKALEFKTEYEYLSCTEGECLIPAFNIDKDPPKQRLQQELRILSKTLAFREIVKWLRKRFWIPPHRTFVVYSPDPEHDDLSGLTDYLWIDLIARVRNLSTGIEIKVGGMDHWEHYHEWWDKLLDEKSQDLGEAQRPLFRFHIRWLLDELGLTGQYGQTLEQYILFGYADPVPTFKIHTDGSHESIYARGSSICIEIYPYTKAHDITKHWNEVENTKKRLWGKRGTRSKSAPNLKRDFEWYRLVTQEGKGPEEIAEMELDESYGEIDGTIIRTAVNRFKKRYEANA